MIKPGRGIAIIFTEGQMNLLQVVDLLPGFLLLVKIIS